MGLLWQIWKLLDVTGQLGKVFQWTRQVMRTLWLVLGVCLTICPERICIFRVRGSHPIKPQGPPPARHRPELDFCCKSSAMDFCCKVIYCCMNCKWPRIRERPRPVPGPGIEAGKEEPLLGSQASCDLGGMGALVGGLCGGSVGGCVAHLAATGDSFIVWFITVFGFLFGLFAGWKVGRVTAMGIKNALVDDPGMSEEAKNCMALGMAAFVSAIVGGITGAIWIVRTHTGGRGSNPIQHNR